MASQVSFSGALPAIARGRRSLPQSLSGLPARTRAGRGQGRGRRAGQRRAQRAAAGPSARLGRLLTASTCGLPLGRRAPPTAPHPRRPPAPGPGFQLVRSSRERSSRPGPQRQATSWPPPLHPHFCHSGAGIHSFPVSLCPVPPIRPLPHLFSHPLPRETLPPLSLSPCPRSCASSQHAAHPSGDQHRCFPGAICTPVLPALSFSSISPPAWPRARRRRPAPIPSGLRAGLPPGHVRMEIRQHEWLSASPHEGFEQMRLKSRPKEPSPSLTRVGANFYSSVKQQDYSASVWLRRKDKLEHVRTTRSWGARWSEHRALGV